MLDPESTKFVTRMYDQGVVVLPTNKDRAPMVGYGQWWAAPPTLGELLATWDAVAEHNPSPSMMCGPVVVVDIDHKNDHAGTVRDCFVAELRERGLLERAYIEQTKSGGVHLVWLVDHRVQTEVLAYGGQPQTMEDEFEGKPVEFRPVIEVLATNHLCRCWPTPGISIVQGSIQRLSKMSSENLALVFDLAREYNQKPVSVTQTITWQESKKGSGVRPGDDYNAGVSVSEVCDILTSNGWTMRRQNPHRITFSRPGAKTKGVDADVHIGKRTFMVYSTSVSDYEPGKAYSFFDVYLREVHAGNVASAASALSSEGWGGGGDTAYISDFEQEVAALAEVEASSPDEFLVDFSTEENFEFTLFHNARRGALSTLQPVAGPGMIVGVGGEEKSRKTALVAAIAAAALSGKECAGFVFNEPGKIVWVDTEQGRYWARRTLRRIVGMAGMVEIPDRLRYYAIRKLGPKQRMAKLEEIYRANPDATVFVVDGIKDLLVDYNDNKDSDAAMGKIMAMTEADGRKCLFFVVLHINKGDKTLRGHIGSEVLKKADAVCVTTLSNDGYTNVVFTASRENRPQSFSFFPIGDNMPHIDGYPAPGYVDERGQLVPDKTKITHTPVRVFNHQDEYGEHEDSSAF